MKSFTESIGAIVIEQTFERPEGEFFFVNQVKDACVDKHNKHEFFIQIRN